MKNNSLAGKSTRTKIFTVITVVAILLLALLNIFVSSFGIYANAYIDLTPEGLYTLRDAMVDASGDILSDDQGNPIDPGITVTFCNDRDKLIDDTYTRVVYYMALAMSRKFSNFDIEVVNVNLDPNAVAKYKTTSLTNITADNVIVSCGSRYRILSARDFWHHSSKAVVSYDGEYKLASVMMSLTMVNHPVAYFVTDHGETYYDASNLESEGSLELESFANLLFEKGFAIKTLSLSELIANADKTGKVASIPDDCVLLIINNPTKDFAVDDDKLNSFYYTSETELLDKYMTENRGSIMVAKDYRVTLPNLENFLSEWGIAFGNKLVKDDESFIENDEGTNTTLITEYNKDEASYGYGVYGDFASLASAPITVISDTGYVYCSYNDSQAQNEPGSYNTARVYAPFLFSSNAAQYYAYNDISGEYNAVASDPGRVALAAVSGRQKMDGETGNYSYSYIFCAASAEFFGNALIGNSSYANYDVTSALVHNIARLESYADSSLGGLSANNSGDSFLGKFLVSTEISEQASDLYEWDPEIKKNVIVRTIYGLPLWQKIVYSIVVSLVPIAIAVVGIVVCVKRKYL